MHGKIEAINRRLKETRADFSVEHIKVNKNNTVLDGLRLCGHTNIQPIVYINAEEFMETDISKVIEELCETYKNYSLPNIDTSALCSMDYILKRVYPKLVSKSNLPWIKENELVYTKFLDMLVLYFVIISDEDSNMQSFTLCKQHIGEADVRDIHGAALSNLRKHTDVIPMSKMLEGFIPEDAPDFMWILTNSWKINGAAVILLKDLLEDLSATFGEDYIVLPSSVHEVIATPIGMACNLNVLLDMVSEINESQVSSEDRLTNNVYIWDGALRPFVK